MSSIAKDYLIMCEDYKQGLTPLEDLRQFHAHHQEDIIRASLWENRVSQRSRDLARVLTFLLEEGNPQIAIALQADNNHLGVTLLNHPSALVINLFLVTTPEKLEHEIHTASLLRPDSTIVLYGGEDDGMKLSQEVKVVVYRAIMDREVQGRPISPTARLVIMHPQVSSLYDPTLLDKLILVKEET